MHEHDRREEVRKLELGLPYLLKHNQEHVEDLKKWIKRARNGQQDEAANDLEKVNGYMKHFDDETEKETCFKRSMNFFKFQKTVAEKTLQQLETLKRE